MKKQMILNENLGNLVNEFNALPPIIIARGPGLERDSLIKKILYYPLRLFLNILPPKLGSIIFTAFSGPQGDTTIVHQYAGTYKAIEVPYSYPERKAIGKTNLSDYFWENFLLSARAVRNRLKIVKKELTKIIFYFLDKEKKIRILSLGSGSARGIIETLNCLKHYKNLIEVKCIDFSRKALQFAKELANYYEVDLEIYRGNVNKMVEYCKENNYKPNVLEMVGLFDYYKGQEANDLIKKCYQVLSFGGYFIISNATPNIETPFFTKGMNWILFYRTPEELTNILLQAGFEIKRIVWEPLKVHVVIIAQKNY